MLADYQSIYNDMGTLVFLRPHFLLFGCFADWVGGACYNGALDRDVVDKTSTACRRLFNDAEMIHQSGNDIGSYVRNNVLVQKSTLYMYINYSLADVADIFQGYEPGIANLEKHVTYLVKITNDVFTPLIDRHAVRNCIGEMEYLSDFNQTYDFFLKHENWCADHHNQSAGPIFGNRPICEITAEEIETFYSLTEDMDCSCPGALGFLDAVMGSASSLVGYVSPMQQYIDCQAWDDLKNRLEAMRAEMDGMFIILN